MERAVAPFLVSKDWEPMSPMLGYGVYASRWPQGAEAVWTIVNRNEYDVDGDQMEVPAAASFRYFDRTMASN
jgi:gamma-glutamyl hercynylcysteine S-oxide synthase